MYHTPPNIVLEKAVELEFLCLALSSLDLHRAVDALSFYVTAHKSAPHLTLPLPAPLTIRHITVFDFLHSTYHSGNYLSGCFCCTCLSSVSLIRIKFHGIRDPVCLVCHSIPCAWNTSTQWLIF